MSAWGYASEDERDEGRRAYDSDDPKHPDYESLWWEKADRLRKIEKEEGLDAA